MKLGRRSFLGMLPAAPFAAKEAAQAAVSELAGVSTTGLASPGPHGVLDSSAPASDHASMIRKVLSDRKLLQALEDDCRADTRFVSALDPDLAANRSMSMSAKVHIQRERNFQSRLRYRLKEEETGWSVLNKFGIHL